MSRVNLAITGPEARDREADDRDQAARLRDRSALARDHDADERDRSAQDRMQVATGDLKRARTFLQAGAPGDAGVSWEEAGSVIGMVLDHLDDALRDDTRDRRAAACDRRAAACDRRAALADRRTAAEDRSVQAAHREQAAIERAQQVIAPAAADPGGAEQLYARVRSARAQAQVLCQQARAMQAAFPPRQDVLRRSEHARRLARLETMPVIEQAKGIIMSQSRCGEQEAFDLLRRASQHSNVPVRDLAAKLVAKSNRPASTEGPGPTAVPLPSR